MEHVRSYYAASANPAPRRAPLEGEATADVCVIGGGIAGCSTALHLAERGYRVVLLEGKRIAWGASGRSGGQAIFGFAAGQDKLEAQVGKETARRMFDVSVEALDLLKDRVARHSIDCDLNWGQLHVAIKPRHETELKAWREELAERYGYDSLRWLARDELRQLLDTERYLGGLYDSRSGHLHPLHYTLGLARAAESPGAPSTKQRNPQAQPREPSSCNRHGAGAAKKSRLLQPKWKSRAKLRARIRQLEL